MKSLLAVVVGLVLLAVVPVPLASVDAQDPAPPPQPLSISGADKVEPYRLVRLRAVGTPAKAGRLWKVRPVTDPKAVIDWATGRNVEKLEFVAPPGQYLVVLSVGYLGADGQFVLDEAELTVTIGVPEPIPPPKPKPDDPKPPIPAPGQGLRVLIVRESGAATPSWLQSGEVRAYLDTHCVKSPSGVPEWRIYDPQQVVTNHESASMKAFWEATKPNLGVLPQIAIANGTAGQLHPLPATGADALALLKKYGGE